MKLRDLSIRKRLLAGNFLMVLIPLVIMTVVSAGLMGLIRHAPWEQHRNLDTFFPNAGRGVAIQFTLGILQGDINDSADRQDSLINIQDDVKRLATFGVYSAVIYNDQLIYQNENLGDPQLNLLRHIGNDEKSSYIWWDEKGLTYRYVSSKDNLIVLGYAPIEFRVGMPKIANRDSGPITFWDQLQGQGAVITMIIGGIVILILGIYLSRLFYQQILGPLKVLQKATKRIQEGDLKTPVPVISNDELGATLQAFDVMRNNLRKSQELQAHYEQNRKELIVGISHDLATPLTMIKGYTSGLMDGIANTPAKREAYLKKILDTTTHMETLVQDLFLFSKLDIGHIDFDLQDISLSEFFSDWMSDNAASYKARGLTIKLKNTLTLKTLAYLDGRQFKRIVDNIVSNALKYKDKDQGQLVIGLRQVENTIELVFADNGPGVDSQDLSKLFETFYRTDRARTNTQNGSGLGLSIVKQLVEGMRGSIVASETPGGGLTFTISLPLRV